MRRRYRLKAGKGFVILEDAFCFATSSSLGHRHALDIGRLVRLWVIPDTLGVLRVRL
jgi:hypothetical protein